MIDERRLSGEVDDDGLTCIRERIHCAATQGPRKEINDLEITRFLEAIASVATAVAQRHVDDAQET